MAIKNFTLFFKNYRSIETPIIRIIIYTYIFIFCLFMPKDDDLGWHLAYGEYFAQNLTILRENTFSTQMPSYKYINSAWLTDLLTYLVFDSANFLGIAFLSSIVLTVTFYLFSKAYNLTLLHELFIFPLVLLFEAPLFNNSFRGQLLSFLGISILFYLLSKKEIKYLMYLPLLFLFWVNLHGQFFLGLILFLIWIIFKLSSLVYDAKILGIIFLSSILLTFINPFGADIYYEVFRHARNPLQRYIIEWSSIDNYSFLWWYLYIWLFLIGISSLIIIYKKKLSDYGFYIFISFILLFISFSIVRYMWISFLISIPLIKHLFNFTKDRILARTLVYFLIILGASYLTFIKIPSLLKTGWNWETYCLYRNCSIESARFLESYENYSNLFSDYNLGGWLIWNYPKIKPLIDGRMPFWVDQNGYSAFKNYIEVENNIKDIDQTKYDLVYISPFKPVTLRLLKLAEEGKWEIIYQDPKAFIFKRL